MASRRNFRLRQLFQLAAAVLALVLAASPAGGQLFPTPTRVTPYARSVSVPGGYTLVEPRLAVDSQARIHVVWFNRSSGNFDVYHARSTDGGVSFSAPVNLSANPGFSGEPQIVIDPDGTIYIVWGDYDGIGNFEIFFVRSLDALFQHLIADVVALNLRRGISNSLDAKLQAALDALGDRNQNNNAAINSLQAFINAVEAQRGVHISNTDADVLIAAAQSIIAQLSEDTP